MIVIPSLNPELLLSSIKSKINSGVIKSWVCDKDGDFTISYDTWKNKAWLTPECAEGELKLYILPPKETHISTLIYAVYHARFLEMIVHRFDEEISGSVRVTPLPDGNDVVS